MKGTVVFDFDYTLADTARFKEALRTEDDADAVLSRMTEFVLPGAPDLLRRLKAAGWKLALLTFGEPGWQERKAACSGLLALFDYVLCTAEPKAERTADFSAWPGPLVFVNDDGEEIDAMLPLLPEARFVAVRGPKAAPTRPDVPVCLSLEDVYEKISMSAG